MSISPGAIPFEAYKGAEPYIFVCYSHQDSEIVFTDLKHLHNDGYRIWYDEGISPTKEWSDEIANALVESAIFIYFVSPRSINSKHCRNEVNFALEKNKPFLPIYIEETKLSGGLELRLSHIQAVIKQRLSLNDYYKKIDTALDEYNVKEKSPQLASVQPTKLVDENISAPEPDVDTGGFTIKPSSLKYLLKRRLFIGGVVLIMILFGFYLWITRRPDALIVPTNSNSTVSIPLKVVPPTSEVPINPWEKKMADLNGEFMRLIKNEDNIEKFTLKKKELRDLIVKHEQVLEDMQKQEKKFQELSHPYKIVVLYYYQTMALYQMSAISQYSALRETDRTVAQNFSGKATEFAQKGAVQADEGLKWDKKIKDSATEEINQFWSKDKFEFSRKRLIEQDFKKDLNWYLTAVRAIQTYYDLIPFKEVWLEVKKLSIEYPTQDAPTDDATMNWVLTSQNGEEKPRKADIR